MSEVNKVAGDDPARTAPLLRRGSKGPEVASVQRLLRAAGYAPGEVDGVYGPQTAAAIRKFQAENKLGVDGIVGPLTRRLLDDLAVPARRTPPESAATTKKAATRATPAKAAASTASATTRKTATRATPAKAARVIAADESLREVQRALRAAGFAPGDADGLHGPNTAAAVRTFQLVHGLDATGQADAETVGALVNQRLRLSETGCGGRADGAGRGRAIAPADSHPAAASGVGQAAQQGAPVDELEQAAIQPDGTLIEARQAEWGSRLARASGWFKTWLRRAVETAS